MDFLWAMQVSRDFAQAAWSSASGGVPWKAFPISNAASRLQAARIRSSVNMVLLNICWLVAVKVVRSSGVRSVSFLLCR